MSEVQIIKLNKQMALKEEEHRKQKSILIQKIELLQAEIIDYQDKQQKHRQLNDSIIMTYRQNQSFLEQASNREIIGLTSKNQEDIKKLKSKHFQQKKKWQQQKTKLRSENDQLKLDIQRLHLQSQKKLAQAQGQFEQRLKNKEEDYQNIMKHKLQMLNERLRQSQDMNRFYKQNVQLRKPRQLYQNQYNEHRSGSVLSSKDKNLIKAMKSNQNGYQQLRKTQQNITSINLRINRALIQLNPNNRKLQDRIRQIKHKKLDEY